jgi:hypothetical protein
MRQGWLSDLTSPLKTPGFTGAQGYINGIQSEG